MKGKKTMNRSYRRRRIQRKRQKTTVSTTNALSPIPSRFITKMKYAEAAVLSGIGMQTYRWNLNSLWDPNRTGLGHQPYGFDQLTGTIYNRYRVISCKYVVSAISDNFNIACAVLPSNEAAPPISNVSEARENPRCQYLVQNPGGTLKVITGTVSIPKLMGRTKAQYMASDSYQAQYSASPTELAVLNVYTQGLSDDASVTIPTTVNILLEYTVELFDPNNVDQSS